MKKVFIDGSEGTTGLRIADRLAGRDDIELLGIAPELRKDEAERARISNMADIVFLCLPDAAAKEAVRHIDGPCVIDASTAHRTSPGWAYGFPELSEGHRESILKSKRIAVPGCHASGFIAAVYPLVAAGVLPRNYPLTCHSITGYSGGGKGMIAQYQAADRPEKLNSPVQYALGQRHKHLPEMRHVCGLDVNPVLNPIVCDYYEGMMVTVPLHTGMMERAIDAQEIWAVYFQHYLGQQLVKVLPFSGGGVLADGTTEAGALAGLDTMEIIVCGHEEHAVIIVRFDNLGKGASGAAVQCMNLVCGFEETAGLCCR